MVLLVVFTFLVRLGNGRVVGRHDDLSFASPSPRSQSTMDLFAVLGLDWGPHHHRPRVYCGNLYVAPPYLKYDPVLSGL